VRFFNIFILIFNNNFKSVSYSSPRQVTGSRESYLFWNKIGRQRVLQIIESSLEY